VIRDSSPLARCHSAIIPDKRVSKTSAKAEEQGVSKLRSHYLTAVAPAITSTRARLKGYDAERPGIHHLLQKPLKNINE
jgi:hypothetical protein